MRITFIGGGVMAEAMMQGIIEHELATPTDIVVSEPVVERREALAKRFGVEVTGDNRSAFESSEIVIFAVKPQNLAEVMHDLRGNLGERLAISIVAGAKLSTLEDGLHHDRVVRVMPNTPAQIGQGMSVWTATPAITTEQRDSAKRVLTALGREVYVSDEKYIDMATAVSGTGPAYVFIIMESLIDAAVHIGMNRQMAEDLVLQTMVGSALFAQQSGKHPAELRNMVTSPAGTTASGLLKLEQGGLRVTLLQGVIAAYERALELGRTDSK